MKTNQANTHLSHPNECRYALRRGVDYWALMFEGRETIFKHELGALYVAYLLLNPPKKPLHAVALALKAREAAGKPAGPDEVLGEQNMGLEDAAAVRALWRRQRELERVLADRLEIEPVKAEALRELEEVTEYLRKSPWLSRHGADRCVEAVATAIGRFHAHLAGALDAEGKPDAVLRAFAPHLLEHLLAPSGRGCGRAGTWLASVPAGCFTYEPPSGVVWEVQSLTSKVQSPACGVQSPKSKAQGPGERRPGAAALLSRFLCVGFALALLATGCTSTRPLKGGKAVTTRKPAGVIEQTLVQGENPSQPSKQSQESVKVRSYTLPAGTRIEQSLTPGTVAPQTPPPTAASNQPSTTNCQPSSAFTLSTPVTVVEREETHACTELGSAQHDTARELGAKLASLKGIVWVGVGLFVFGLASLVWPPLKAIIGGSVTTSGALMLGGVALMVLPTLVVGNELLILGVVVLAVGGWFLAHRHGQLRGMVAASSGASSPDPRPATPVTPPSVTSNQ
jgi:hypothetical protein